MMFTIIAVSFALVALSIASIEDLKTREVPDYLSYFLIGGAIFVRAIWFLADKDRSIVYWIPVSLAVLGGFSYLMYKRGQWGGGDVKVVIGIALLLSSFKNETIPFFINFLFNTLIVGAFYGIIYMGLLALKHIKKIKLNIYEKLVLPTIVIIAILLFYKLPLVISFLGSIILVSLGALVYIKKIESKIMIANIPIEKLTEGDWLVSDVKLNGKVYLKKQNIGLTLKDIKKLKKVKDKIKKVKIKEGIPFVPVFLIAVIATLLFGNIILKLFLLS